jgi:dipeptidyl aminopeptidase/acylaminoacyl peptidase
MNPLKPITIPFAFTLLLLQGQPANKFALTVDNLMRGPALYGYEPTDVRWSGDGEKIFFQWKQASDPQNADMDTYTVNRDGSALRKLTDSEAKVAPPSVGGFQGGDTTRDKRLTIYSRGGDIFVYDASTGQTRQLTKTGDAESNPHFLRDGKRFSFVRANNLYVMGLETPVLEQLTDIRAGAATPAAAAPPAGGGGGRRGGGGAAASPTDPPKGTDSQEFLKKEERDLLETVRERATKREADEAKRKKENPRKPFMLSARQSVMSLQLTPDEKYVVATISESGDRTKNTVVPSFVTESAYTEDIPSRNKVGDVQAKTRLALVSVETGENKWVESGQKRDVQLSAPVWSEDGTKAVLFARASDNKDRWILALDEVAGTTRVLASDHDDAWVGGPGMGGGPGGGTLGWMKGDDAVYFQSEKTGYSHLYTVPFAGGEAKALTSGKWEVMSARLSKDKSKFYLTTSEADLGEHNFYEMSAEGGACTRITAMPGWHSAVVSPDERWVADVYSYANKPPELYVQENRAGAAAKKLTTSPSAEFGQYAWLDAPIVTFQARDGVSVRARLYKPANFRKGGAAVVFVHGAGYLQNVHKGWSGGYAHEYLFHHLLVERGFLVIDVDYRGSAGYGRDWRTGIYEHMGGKDLDDEVDAAKWIVAQHGVDPKKIGMYGGSYGGFMTLMALFTQPDVFASGAALRPVTDWAHYNHGYTSNILNQPQGDPEAYRKSSPIYFAKGLKGSLLICHGMVDTNVHFQDTVRLVQRLIELHKENWELAVFPVEDHGFREAASWTDEYKRILALFERTLR